MKQIKLKIKLNGVFKEYFVPNNITVLEALEYINKTYNENIQYRASCRAGQCGSCAMTINNEPKLACKTKVEHNTTIEPLKNFIVIKDLIVDREQYYKKLNNIRNYVENEKEIFSGENIQNKEDTINDSENTENNKIDTLKDKTITAINSAGDITNIKKIRGCIDCLSCLSKCPAKEFSEYPGPTLMRQIARFAFDKRDNINRCEMAFFENLPNCTTCGKCVEVCPKEIDIVHNAVEKLRAKAFENGYYLKEHMEVRKNVLNKNNNNRSIIKEKTPLLEEVHNEYIVEHEKMRVAFFTGCLVDYRLQDVGKSAIKILNAHGISVIIPKNQICCGSPFIRTGQTDVANTLKNHNLNIFNNLEVDAIITVCAGCGSTLKNDYKEKEFKVMDITEILNKVGLINYNPLKDHTKLIGIPTEEHDKKIKITYHDPCHLRRGQGIFVEPRKILRHIPNLEFIEMELPDQCCGAGGGVRSGKPELASAIGKRKAKMIADTDADFVITVCPFCEYHIKDSINKYNKENDIKKDTKVLNIVSLLDKVI
ncbi:succinate dehydrogenase and fumarate reductase iron-sulfur protein [Methanococcus aeolicus Nankai-3]|uniref:Succinate dehydrogenase and fumarate reductase iron-sulfur protein n=1 Tax=Methanococcus aeolicus (strain ATCC BAA-1280 / DSM 17508 / OCM 812 / Nankai-3) TaxID=419665 RepID=A6UUX8_META3|nr:fumarate reductase (CoM/CoB) subunit TfrB [Methanococcus aeolicus]ABR56300.1 succinate dehydrogenase and fumarate reductase iron-sulfur protein [Methanococcus aeolicus Nankai-3]